MGLKNTLKVRHLLNYPPEWGWTHRDASELSSNSKYVYTARKEKKTTAASLRGGQLNWACRAHAIGSENSRVGISAQGGVLALRPSLLPGFRAHASTQLRMSTVLFLAPQCKPKSVDLGSESPLHFCLFGFFCCTDVPSMLLHLLQSIFCHSVETGSGPEGQNNFLFQFTLCSYALCLKLMYFVFNETKSIVQYGQVPGL